MESSQEKYILIQNFIPIQTRVDEKVRSIVYLAGEKCAILYQSQILIVDLNLRRKQCQELYPLSDIQYIYPIGDGLLCTQYSEDNTCYIQINQKREFKAIESLDSLFGSRAFVPYYSSGILLTLNESEAHILDSQSSIREISLRYHTGLRKANDIDSAFTQSGGLNGWELINLRTMIPQRLQFPLGFSKHSSSMTNLYTINQLSGIYSLQLQKEEQTIIGMMQLSSDGIFEHILTYPRLYHTQFSIMNPSLNLLMFSLKSNAMEQTPDNRTILFNYQSKKVVLEIKEDLLHMDPRRVSSTFNHFLCDVGREGKDKGGKEWVRDYVPVNIKKLYMHIAKETHIESMFGLDIVRRVLALVL